MGSGLFQEIEYILQGIYSIIYGKEDTCILCGEPEDVDYMCTSCRKQVNLINFKYSIGIDNIEFPCYSLGVYSYQIKKLILLLKYEKEFLAGRILASYLSEFIEENLKGMVDMITFIPSSRESFKRRGFNQCELMCKYISKQCNIPYKGLMYKSDEGRDQIGLDTTKRWENVKDCFKMKKNKNIVNKRILLIDDVITSGATSFYGAKCLKYGGAKEVYILTVAKSGV